MPFLLSRILDDAAAAAPQRIAATLGDDSVTFGELDARVGRLANILAGMGIGRGDRVLFWSTISVRCHEMFFATARIGAAFVPVNPAGSYEEVRAIAEYALPRMLIVDAEHCDIGEALARDLGLPLAVLGATGAVPGTDLDREAIRAAERFTGEPPREEDIHVIFLTSGSTGRPKGVMISQRAGWLRANSFQTQASSGGRGDVNMFPLFHMAGWTQVTSSMIHLRTNHIVRKADAETLLRTVERHRALRLYCIPAVWDRILEYPDTFDTSSLRQVQTGTYRVDPAVMAALSERFPSTQRQVVYGSTEAGIDLVLDDDEIASHPDGVGLPVRGVRARISDEGELEIAADFMMDGYFALPEQTAEVLQDGWYKTGDLAEQYDDGTYRIVGRAREVIRSGGETVAPAEVESALANFPSVRQVAVIGLPDARWGEIVCAALVMEEGAALPSCEALRAHLAPKLATYKHPRAVVALDEVPKTAATQQLQRSKVKEMILARGTRVPA